MLKVIFKNEGGELDSRTVESPVDVRGAIEDMLKDVSELFGGDQIVVVDLDAETS